MILTNSGKQITAILILMQSLIALCVDAEVLNEIKAYRDGYFGVPGNLPGTHVLKYEKNGGEIMKLYLRSRSGDFLFDLAE